MNSGTDRLHRLVWGCCVVALILAWGGKVLAAPAPVSILLMSSYGHGDPWTDGVVAGFIEAFPPAEARVFVEHLDSRRWPGGASSPEFLAYLAAKYRDIPLAAVVSADDAALNFWLVNRAALFPGLPLVFCGVNDYSPTRLAGQRNITGVLESPDVLGTLELGLGLFPTARTIVAFGSDQNVTGRANLERFRRAMAALGRRARALEILNARLDDARTALAAAPRDALALRLSPLLDAAGVPSTRASDLTSLSPLSPVPILGLWDFDLNTGALGGRVVRSHSHGQAAAGLVRAILAGQSADTLPVVEASAESVLDAQVMQRFDLAASAVPAGTVMLNEPVSSFAACKLALWCLAGALVIFVPLAVVLAVVLRSRKRIEAHLAESERRYRELVECAHSLILRFDQAGQLVFVNEYAEQLLGYSREELLAGEASFWPEAPANLTGLLARAMAAPEDLAGDAAENEVVAKDGRRVFIHWDNCRLLDMQGKPEGWLAVGSDLTARRLAEEALAARALAEEELSGFAQELLIDAPGAEARAMRHLLTAFGVSRVLWFDNVTDTTLGSCCRLAGEAAAAGLPLGADLPSLALLPYSLDGFQWADAMLGSETVAKLVEEVPLGLQEVMLALDIRAFLSASIWVNGVWAGSLLLGDTRLPRRFTRQEHTLLTTAASLFSVYLSRNRS